MHVFTVCFYILLVFSKILTQDGNFYILLRISKIYVQVKINCEGTMKFLTRREELILLSIGNLKDDAYLVAIREHLSSVMGKKWSISTIHIPLRRLEKAGYIDAFFGEATAVRGGRRKKIYKISSKGMEALSEYKKVNDVLWEKFVDFDFAK